MTLKTDAATLYEEILSAERLRDSVLESYDEMKASYHGPFYSKDKGASEYAPENHYYEYLSLMVPRLVYDNPRVSVKTRRQGTQALTADAIRHGVNRWVRDVNLRKTLSRIATDMLFNFGVVMVSQQPNGGLLPNTQAKEAPVPYWPQVLRVPQRMFFIDPKAKHASEARYMGHRWIRDKEDLIEEAKANKDAGWELSALTDLKTSTGAHEELEHEVDRNEVEAYEIWIPEVDADDSPGQAEGFHGTIYTLALNYSSGHDAKPEFIRKPRPFYGPRWGPYTVFGVYNVPDQVYPLSPLVAVEGQIQDLNAQANAARIASENYKKLIFVDKTDPRLEQRLKDSKTDFIIPVSGVERQRFVQAEIGGMTQTQLSYIELAKERLDRNSGIHDAQRGTVSGRGTATEVSVAAESSNLRTSFLKQQFADAITSVLRTVAWYMYYDDRVVFPLGKEAEDSMGVKDPWLVGGDHDPQSGSSFDDLELEIEAYSMERTSEGVLQKKTMELMSIITQIAPAMPQMPLVNWGALIKRLGDGLNIPDADTLIDVNMAYAMAGTEAPPQPQSAMLQKSVGGDKFKASPILSQGSSAQVPMAAQDKMPGVQSGVQAAENINSQRRA